MQSVGQQIREQRLRLGLKLEEISARSRISLKMLQAIETDDLSGISSPFLYKSFTRQFAEHLKLDYQALAPAVDTASLRIPQPRMPGEGDVGRTNLEPLPMKRSGRNFRWLYSVASLAFMLVACSSIYGLWQNSKATWVTDITGLFQGVTSRRAVKSTPAAEPPPSNVSSPRHAPAERPAPHFAAHRPQDDTLAAVQPDAAVGTQDSMEFRVELSAVERTWLSIVEDGRQTFTGMLEPEQTKVLEGHDMARIRAGNAGGINCVFNGQSIGPLGPRGQVRTVVFTKSNYEVLDAPAHIALTHFPSLIE